MKNGPYILLKAPSDYPGKKYRDRYAYEHTIVWWQNTGFVPPAGYIIHHKNENKHDNNFENLELISTSSHTEKHITKKNKFIALMCALCNEPFLKEKRNFNFKKNNGQERFYCCRSHQVIDQHKRRKLKLNH